VRWPSQLVLPVLCATAIAAGATTEDDPRPADPEVVAAVDARLQAVKKTIGLLNDRYRLRSQETAGRVRAMYKLARAGWAPLWVDVDQRRLAARRRAAARQILHRDLHELELLRDEMAVADAAHDRLERERSQARVVRPSPHSLARPVKGPLLTRFGTYRDPESRAELVRRGVELRCQAGSPVGAVEAGTVRYAGPLRGLGVAVVVAHDGFLSVVGKLAQTGLAVGDRVERGAPLGTAAGRRVYLEVRLAVGDGGYPVDPAPLLE